jgi:hypothetical protein
VVISAPQHVSKRHVIRQTWAHQLANSSSSGNVGQDNYVFFVGLTRNSEFQELIEKESKIYGDIVQINMRDSYQSLTEKTIAMLYWVDKFCKKASFVVKVS